MMRSASVCGAIALLMVLNACATLTADADQAVAVRTEPAGASCALANDKGDWRLESTPGVVTVKRSFQPLALRCSKPGAGEAHTALNATTRGRAYGNILLLGVPAVIDAYTGKGYEYEIPAEPLVLQK